MFVYSPFSLLWTVCLFQDVLGLCERPAWANLVWELTPQELEQLTAKEETNCLHYAIGQIGYGFTGLELSQRCLDVLYASCKVALFLVGCLSVHYLLLKLKLKLKKGAKPCQKISQRAAVSMITALNAEQVQNMDKMMNKVVGNTTKLIKYMKYIAHRHKKEDRQRKLRRKLEMDEEEQFLPICTNYHSSSGETPFHEN